MAAYYNEIDPFAANWLRNLIAAGRIPPGDVDERSIAEVRPGDLKGYDQCHFFAGIGGWAYAARLAGIPDDYLLWTGSCPCQPFSSAGKRLATEDERHLWPVFRDLIAECRPPVVAGEQVGGALGLQWLDGVAADFEQTGYAFGAANLCASLAGLPRRARLFWVAHAHGCGQRWGAIHEEAPCISSPSERSAGSWLLNRRVVSCGDGISGRVGRRRGYGNAIVPQIAAAFLAASLSRDGPSDER